MNMNNKSNNSIYIKILVSWTIVIVWAGVIFYLSSKTADQSTVQSRGVIGVFTGMFGTVIQNDEVMETVDGIVRESAHGVEYLILGVVLFNALFITLNYRKQEEELLTAQTGIECRDKYRWLNCMICSILICCIYALTDEIHQIPIPGRTFQIMDLIIDTIGSIIGSVLMCVFYKVRKK